MVRNLRNRNDSYHMNSASGTTNLTLVNCARVIARSWHWECKSVMKICSLHSLIPFCSECLSLATTPPTTKTTILIVSLFMFVYAKIKVFGVYSQHSTENIVCPFTFLFFVVAYLKIHFTASQPLHNIIGKFISCVRLLQCVCVVLFSDACL